MTTSANDSTFGGTGSSPTSFDPVKRPHVRPLRRAVLGMLYAFTFGFAIVFGGLMLADKDTGRAALLGVIFGLVGAILFGTLVAGLSKLERRRHVRQV